MSKCPSCGSSSVQVQEAEGQKVCTSCGFLVEEDQVVQNVEFADGAGGSSQVIGQYVSATSTRPYSSHTRGMGQGKGSKERAVELGRALLSQLASQLRIPPHLVDSATRIYIWAMTENLLQGRRSGLVIGATLYLSCRRENYPVLLVDFSEAMRVNMFSLGATFIRLTRALRLRLPTLDPALYLQRFAGQLDLGAGLHRVVQTASRVISRMRRDWLTEGRRPHGLCGAALLVACRVHGFQRTREEVVRAVSTTDMTLRNRLAEFEATPAAALAPGDLDRPEEELDRGVLRGVEGNPPAFVRSSLVEEALKQGDATSLALSGFSDPLPPHITSQHLRESQTESPPKKPTKKPTKKPSSKIRQEDDLEVMDDEMQDADQSFEQTEKDMRESLRELRESQDLIATEALASSGIGAEQLQAALDDAEAEDENPGISSGGGGISSGGGDQGRGGISSGGGGHGAPPQNTTSSGGAPPQNTTSSGGGGHGVPPQNTTSSGGGGPQPQNDFNPSASQPPAVPARVSTRSQTAKKQLPPYLSLAPGATAEPLRRLAMMNSDWGRGRTLLRRLNRRVEAVHLDAQHRAGLSHHEPQEEEEEEEEETKEDFEGGDDEDEATSSKKHRDIEGGDDKDEATSSKKHRDFEGGDDEDEATSSKKRRKPSKKSSSPPNEKEEEEEEEGPEYDTDESEKAKRAKGKRRSSRLAKQRDVHRAIAAVAKAVADDVDNEEEENEGEAEVGGGGRRGSGRRGRASSHKKYFSSSSEEEEVVSGGGNKRGRGRDPSQKKYFSSSSEEEEEEEERENEAGGTLKPPKTLKASSNTTQKRRRRKKKAPQEKKMQVRARQRYALYGKLAHDMATQMSEARGGVPTRVFERALIDGKQALHEIVPPTGDEADWLAALPPRGAGYVHDIIDTDGPIPADVVRRANQDGATSNFDLTDIPEEDVQAELLSEEEAGRKLEIWKMLHSAHIKKMEERKRLEEEAARTGGPPPPHVVEARKKRRKHRVGTQEPIARKQDEHANAALEGAGLVALPQKKRSGSKRVNAHLLHQFLNRRNNPEPPQTTTPAGTKRPSSSKTSSTKKRAKV